MASFESAFNRNVPKVYMLIVVVAAVGAGVFVRQFAEKTEQQIDENSRQSLAISAHNFELYKELKKR